MPLKRYLLNFAENVASAYTENNSRSERISNKRDVSIYVLPPSHQSLSSLYYHRRRHRRLINPSLFVYVLFSPSLFLTLQQNFLAEKKLSTKSVIYLNRFLSRMDSLRCFRRKHEPASLSGVYLKGQRSVVFVVNNVGFSLQKTVIEDNETVSNVYICLFTRPIVRSVAIGTMT